MLARILMAAAGLVACVTVASAQEPKLVEPGKLTWGSSPTFAPFEFVRDGKPMGFDIDLVDELAKRSGLTSNMMGMEFKGVVPALLGGRVDIGVSGLYITPERLAAVDFIPYVLVGNQIVVKKGNPKKVAGPSTLCGLKAGAAVNTAFEASTKKLSEECKAAGKPEIDILSLPGTSNVAAALAQGRIDAALTSTATIAAMINENPDTYDIASDPFDVTTKVGIAVGKDNGALKAKLDAALQAMAKDGTYASLMKKWNLPAQASVF